MRNRVYGVCGIRSRMSNWNADFSGRPKTTSKNEIFGSDKALKYPMKVTWDQEGEKVLYLRSYTINVFKKEKIFQPKLLIERYKEIFEIDPKEQEPKAFLKTLFSAIDVMNFGATFAESNLKTSIIGAVQIGQGFNIYNDSRVEVQDILSPFKNSGKDHKKDTSTTLGTKIVCDEAHYCYPFTVNPFVYDNYKKIIDGFEGYTREAYNKFKDASLRSATAFATNSKFGSDNEYSIFIEMKEDSKIYLPELSQFVSFEKGEENVLNLETLEKLLSEKVMESVDKIELYYNPLVINIKGFENSDKISRFNIFTREVI